MEIADKKVITGNFGGGCSQGNGWQPISTAPETTAIWLLCRDHPYIGYRRGTSWFVKAQYKRRWIGGKPHDEFTSAMSYDGTPTCWRHIPKLPSQG
jgi:hypothetical protein